MTRRIRQRRIDGRVHVPLDRRKLWQLASLHALERLPEHAHHAVFLGQQVDGRTELTPIFRKAVEARQPRQSQVQLEGRARTSHAVQALRERTWKCSGAYE